MATGRSTALVGLTPLGWGGDRPLLPVGRERECVGCLGALMACHAHTESRLAELGRPGCPPWLVALFCVLCLQSEAGSMPPSVMRGSPLLALLRRCPKREAAAGAPGRSSSFCWESAVHPSSGSCPALAVSARLSCTPGVKAACGLQPDPALVRWLAWGVHPLLLAREEGSCSFRGRVLSSCA